MTYLTRKRGKSPRVHIWLGDDTACKMASTGGLDIRKPNKWVFVHETFGRPVCKMCETNYAKMIGKGVDRG